MSVSLEVLLMRETLPTRDAWQQAILAEGIDLRLDDFDTSSHTGSLPCKLNGRDCGFEYYFGQAEPFATEEPVPKANVGWWARLFGRTGAVVREEPDEADRLQIAIGDNDHCSEFVFRSSIDDGRAAAFAAAVLAQMTDGYFYDPQSGELTAGKEAVALVKSQDRSERDVKMDQAVKKWSNSTQRRCPECSAPCPEYRPTCFVCGVNLGRA